MPKITQLMAEIVAIEASIPADASKADLYELLVQAYYKAMDVIELQRSSSPIIPEASTVEFQALKADYAITSVQLELCQKELAKQKVLTIKYVNQLASIGNILEE